MKTNRILITGGLGFIGMHLVQLLLERKQRILLFDNLSPQIHGAVPDLSWRSLLRSAGVEVFRGDVRRAADWEKVLIDVDVKCVLHLAAETGTAQSMYEISRYTDTNVGGTAALLNYLANHKHKVSKIILASSRAVYGEGAYRCRQCGIVYPPMRAELRLRSAGWEPQCPACKGEIQAAATPECAPTAPASIYAATKLAQEDLLRIASKALGIPAVIFRFQNVYGEGQSLKNPYTGDFVHVSDIARAVVLGLTSDGADGATLNVGSGHPTSVEQVALLLQERLGGKTRPIISGQYRLGDIRHGYADLTAIRACLQYAPEVSLDEGLTRFAEWVKAQPVEPDRLDKATGELVARGLMPAPISAHVRANAKAKAASV